MYHMNKELPYEQQMKVLLHYYDKVVEENEALRARIKELEEEKVKYGDPKELHDQLKALPPSVKQLRHVADERKARLNWVEKELTKHLRKKGVKIPTSVRANELYLKAL